MCSFINSGSVSLKNCFSARKVPFPAILSGAEKYFHENSQNEPAKDMDNLFNKIDRLKEKIKKLNKPITSFFSIYSDATSLPEKKERILQLTNQINFWIDWIENEKNISLEV